MDIGRMEKANYFLRNPTEKGRRNIRNTEYLKATEMGKEEVKEGTGSERSKTDTDIIVKPDGSRILVVTTNIGGMETTMSLEISKPTDMDNQIHQEDVPGQEQDEQKAFVSLNSSLSQEQKS